MTNANDPTVPDELRNELLALAWVLARQRLHLEPGRPPLSPYDAMPLEQRAVWLAIVTACNDLRTAAEDWSRVAARAAAEAGADYGDLGDAVGITRQGARKRWPGLANLTKADHPGDSAAMSARDQEGVLRGTTDIGPGPLGRSSHDPERRSDHDG